MDDREDIRTVAAALAAKLRSSEDIGAVAAAAQLQLRLKPAFDLAERIRIPAAAAAAARVAAQLEVRHQNWLDNISVPRIDAIHSAQSAARRLAEMVAPASHSFAALESPWRKSESDFREYVQSQLAAVDSLVAPAQEQPATQQRDWELEREVRDLGALCEQKSRQLGHHERVMKMEMADIRRLADEGDAVAIAAVNLVEREAAQRATKAAKARSDLRYGPCIELAYRLVRERVPASGQCPAEDKPGLRWKMLC